MRGFISKVLASHTGQHDDTTFWTCQAPQNKAWLLLNRGKVHKVCILPVAVEVEAAEALSRYSHDSNDAIGGAA